MISNFLIRTTCITTLLFLGLAPDGCFGGSDDERTDSELSGYVYVDLDIDNNFDPSEPAFPDVELVLTLLSDPGFSVTAYSDQIGYYEFTGLDAGIYSITQPTLPLAVRNVYVHAGELFDIFTNDPLASYPGTAVLLDQAQGILPHVEEIELPDRARGTDYNFGQIILGKAWLVTPEPSSALLLAIGGLALAARRRAGK
jgi:hypothetical protein